MITDLLSYLDSLLNHSGLWGIFVFMVLENIGVPFPTEAAFLAGQVMVARGVVSYEIVFVVYLAGHTLGSIVSYGLGRLSAMGIREIKSKSSRLKRAQGVFSAWLSKYGDSAVFLSRVVGYVRPWSSYLAGVGEIKISSFLIYNILGSVVIIVLSMLVAGSLVEVWRRFDFLRPYLIIVSLIFFFGFWVWVLLRDRRKKIKI